MFHSSDRIFFFANIRSTLYNTHFSTASLLISQCGKTIFCRIVLLRGRSPPDGVGWGGNSRYGVKNLLIDPGFFPPLVQYLLNIVPFSTIFHTYMTDCAGKMKGTGPRDFSFRTKSPPTTTNHHPSGCKYPSLSFPSPPKKKKIPSFQDDDVLHFSFPSERDSWACIAADAASQSPLPPTSFLSFRTAIAETG